MNAINFGHAHPEAFCLMKYQFRADGAREADTGEADDEDDTLGRALGRIRFGGWLGILALGVLCWLLLWAAIALLSQGSLAGGHGQ